MIFRDLAENWMRISTPESNGIMVHFIGFNALNECEKVSYEKVSGKQEKPDSTGIMIIPISETGN